MKAMFLVFWQMATFMFKAPQFFPWPRYFMDINFNYNRQLIKTYHSLQLISVIFKSITLS